MKELSLTQIAFYSMLLGALLGIGYILIKQATMRIGLSLSFCINDIARGKVKEDRVLKIITSTDAPTKEDWEQILESYCKTYWHDNPENCKAIANRLYANGKIDQPRTRGENPNFVGRTHWISRWQRRPQLDW